MRPRICLQILILLALLLFPAQPWAQMEADSAACKHDVEKLCGNVKPGGGRIRDCLMKLFKFVSVGCKESLERPLVEPPKSRPCLENPADYCRAIPSHDPKFKECVKKEEDRLTLACKEQQKAGKEESAKIQELKEKKKKAAESARGEGEHSSEHH
jgi:hypothetical protein